MTRRVRLEVAVTTAAEAARAAASGADRLELCSGLEVGGLTPSPGAFLAVRESVAVPVWVLLRPRPGGFAYSASEFDTILRDADWFLAHGAAGVVCGVLTAAGGIDRSRCAELVERAKGRAVFHRAFDFLPNLPAALDEVIDHGFVRVLTSGGAALALEGAKVIAELVRRAEGRIGILPGGGIRPENVAELVRATGCHEVHTSLRSPVADRYLGVNPALAGQMGSEFATDAGLVAQTRAELDGLS